MSVSFPYEDRHSKLLGEIKRPYARVGIWSNSFHAWIDYAMLVDTGADYSLFPRSMAHDLGIDLEKDTEIYETRRVGGKENVFMLKKELRIQIGDMERDIIAGILGRDDLPPLLGRSACLDTFDVLFSQHVTYFDRIGVFRMK